MRIRRRPATPADDAFLRTVYASTREHELAAVSWDPAQRDAFLRMQYDVRERAHRDGRVEVILADDVPAGRLHLDHRAAEVRVVDIALLGEFRGRGVGRTVLREVLADAGARGARVTLHVAHDNRARTLYERLGFCEIARSELDALMEHPAREVAHAG